MHKLTARAPHCRSLRSTAVPLLKGDTRTPPKGVLLVSPFRRGTAAERSERQGVARAVSLLVALTILSVGLVTFSAVSIDRLKYHVTMLTNPATEGRRAGSSGAALAADYITQTFMDFGAYVVKQ